MGFEHSQNHNYRRERLHINELRTRLLNECRADEVGLWSIIWEVRYALNRNRYPGKEDDSADPRGVRIITMELVKELIASGQVQVGCYSPDGSGIVPWTIPAEQIVARINLEWDSLGREPNIGEVAVFFGGNPGDSSPK
jgi:hypothetical protein